MGGHPRDDSASFLKKTASTPTLLMAQRTTLCDLIKQKSNNMDIDQFEF